MVDEDCKPETEEDAEAPADGEAPAADAAAAETEDAGAEEFDPLAGQAARIAELEAEAQTLRDERLRALAEVENMRRRSERERRESVRYGATGLARDLLPVADNLRRALASGSGEGLLEGVEMVERELAQAFARHHIVRIEAGGERFDHNRHQAMFEVESARRRTGHGRAGRPGRLPPPRPPAAPGDGRRRQGTGHGRGRRRDDRGAAGAGLNGRTQSHRRRQTGRQRRSPPPPSLHQKLHQQTDCLRSVRLDFRR